jgi:drug/metabolite transporter (DMT)-like permease
MNSISSKTMNGILFIIAGIAPLVIYIGLGPDGADIFDAKLTETLVFWIMLSAPIALMMTANTIKDGDGHGFVKAGLLIFIIAYTGGSVGDALSGSGMNEMGAAISEPFWAAMMLGFTVTAIGYYLQKKFPVWLSGLMAIAGIYGFIALGFIDLTANEVLEMPLWIGFTLVLVLLGIFTIKKAD